MRHGRLARAVYAMHVPMMTRFQTVLFDLDGTLVDSAGDIIASVHHARDSLGYDRLPDETVRGFIGDGIDHLISKCVPPEDVPRGVAAYRAWYDEHMIDTTRPYPGVVALLKALRAEDVALGVVTNKALRYTEKLLAELDLTRFFGAVVGGDGPAGRKPQAGTIEAALQMLSRPKAGAVMVGDARNDVHSARAAGLPVIGLLYGIGGADEMRALAPDWIAASVGEMAALLGVRCSL